jgi:hypothetical protein
MNLRTPSNVFVFNNMAERVGFESTCNVYSTRYSATDGSFGHRKQFKAVLTAGEWQVDFSTSPKHHRSFSYESDRTVTTVKIEANRMNSKRSTGPRTEGGKRNSRFNALTLGLFAKHAVIPICDGYKAEKDFQLLLDGLHQEFEPVGLYEEWLVAKVAESMWRLRRAARCESGSVRESAAPWEKHRPWEDREENLRLLDLQINIWALTDAEQQLRDSGTLSQKTFDRVSPLVEEEQRKTIQSNKSVKPDNPQTFLAQLTNLKASLESTYGAQSRIQDQRSEIRF